VIASVADVDRKAEPVSNVLSLSCIPRVAHNAARTAVVAWTASQRSLSTALGFFHAVRAARLPIRSMFLTSKLASLGSP
jgi:hypothetical protein